MILLKKCDILCRYTYINEKEGYYFLCGMFIFRIEGIREKNTISEGRLGDQLIDMFVSHNKKLIDEYRELEFEIWCYTKGKWKAYYFLRHILCFFRRNYKLCEQHDYKELYDETIVLLILHAHVNNFWTVNNPSDQQKYIELLADLQNKNMDTEAISFSIETIDEYLIYRKKMWKDGKKYTKERYGFIS